MFREGIDKTKSTLFLLSYQASSCAFVPAAAFDTIVCDTRPKMFPMEHPLQHNSWACWIQVSALTTSLGLSIVARCDYTSSVLLLADNEPCKVTLDLKGNAWTNILSFCFLYRNNHAILNFKSIARTSWYYTTSVLQYTPSFFSHHECVSRTAFFLANFAHSYAAGLLLDLGLAPEATRLA